MMVGGGCMTPCASLYSSRPPLPRKRGGMAFLLIVASASRSQTL